MKRLSLRALTVVCIAFLPQASRAQQASDASEQASDTPKEASTEQVERCVSQHESARQLRVSEQWLDARVAMTDCAADRCPLAIGADCRAWLEELNRALPTLLVLIEHGQVGPVERATRVELDGRPIELPDPPAPIELVPGQHRLRVAFAGRPPMDRDFTLEKGEKNHIERVGAAPPPAPQPSARVIVALPPVARGRPIPTSTYVLSAGALAAFTGSTAFLVSALRERNEALVNCAPTCDAAVRKSIETRLVLSDVSASVGLVLSAWAVYVFVRRPTVPSEALGKGPALLASKDSLRLTWKGQF